MRVTAGLIALVLLFLGAPALAAPIRLTAQLDPGQSGPMYAWSLRLRVDPGYDVGAFSVFTTGWTSLATDTYSPIFSDVGNGVTNLGLQADSYGAALSPPGVDTLLATLYGPSNRAADVSLTSVDWEPFFFFPNGDLYPLKFVELRVIPEPPAIALGSLALAAAIARRRTSALGSR